MFKRPKTALFILEFFSGNAFYNNASGDCEEIFYDKCARDGRLRAYAWLWGQALRSAPVFLCDSYYRSLIMLKNYLKIGLRNLVRNKGYSLINISGLAIGMVCVVLICLWVADELSFDRHHEKADRIYRIGPQFGPEPDMRGAFTPPPLAQALLNDYPEVEHVVRMSLWPRNRLIRAGDRQFVEKGIIAADNSIFDVFTIPFIHGSPAVALIEPYTIVISESTARKYFGDENPVGKTLEFDSNHTLYKITGVVRDCPENSHFRFDMIESLERLRSSRSERWMQHTYFTYVVLQEGYAPEYLEDKFPDFVMTHYGPQFYEDTGMNYADYIRTEDYYYGYWLQPLSDIHLNADIVDIANAQGDITYIYVFTAIAAFILLIACINFMNLSTARFSRRAKEVGLRKVFGSNRSQLVRQFLTESVLLSMCALVCALIIIQLILPVFNNMTERQIVPDYFGNFYLLPGLVLLALTAGALAGSYPAFFLSSFQPVRALTASINRTSGGKISLRNVLVVFQLAISFGIIFSTLVVYRQLEFVRQAKMGFDREHIIVVHRAGALGDQRIAFKQELLKNPDVRIVSSTNSLPGRHFDPNGHRLEGWPASKQIIIHTMYGDYDYMNLLDLELAEGRYFSRDIASDMSSAVVINETAVKELGLTDPVGKRLHKDFGGAEEGEFATIIGVLKDFNFHSLHQEILPMIIRPLDEDSGPYLSVKTGGGDLAASLRIIEDTWKEFTGDQPFDYSLFDDDLHALYNAEQKTGEIFAAFSFLAVFIACLGLFGLISYAAEQRTKEIGIRKVLGASAVNIMYLISRETAVLTLIAAAVAIPVTMYTSGKWLDNFAYRDSSQTVACVVSLIVLTAISFLTISYRTIRASRANPAESLRHE